jgi:hypothetical protein
VAAGLWILRPPAALWTLGSLAVVVTVAAVVRTWDDLHWVKTFATVAAP